METTYTLLGGDGQQYGPVTLEQFQAWIREGRVAGEAKVMRSDTQSWQAAAQYPELGLPLAASAPVAPSLPPAVPVYRPVAPVSGLDPLLARRAHTGARWFYWIAGLSLVNVFLTASNGGFFVVGLGVGLFLPTAFAIGVAVLFGVFGFFASKRHSWSFIVGMVLYAGDALLFLLVQEWLGLAFHAYILFRLFVGLRANLQLNAALKRGTI